MRYALVPKHISLVIIFYFGLKWIFYQEKIRFCIKMFKVYKYKK